jgi:tRNA-specific 2-thiouridylase
VLAEVGDTRAPSEVIAEMRAVMRLPAGARVAVAMSGGVDSSAVAALLVEAGYEVFGLTARLYDVDPAAIGRAGTCCAPEDARDARSVAWALGIRHYTLDEREVFARAVVDRFVADYDRGDTPNPCVECNRTLKFEVLVQEARALGAEALATGHYACLDVDASGEPALRRGVDPQKDQSYFLHPLTAEVGAFVRFPLGRWQKAQVRGHAARLDVPVAEKRESMDVCFVAASTPREFVAGQRGARPGTIVDLAGTQLGKHAGIAGFAVGQRHGLGLPPQKPEAAPLYVVDKRPDGTIVVGPHEALRATHVQLRDMSWIGEPLRAGADVELQVRHRGKPIAARVVAAQDGSVSLDVLGELFAAGRGQSGVLYHGDRVLGGGIIHKATLGVREAGADA